MWTGKVALGMALEEAPAGSLLHQDDPQCMEMCVCDSMETQATERVPASEPQEEEGPWLMALGSPS